MTEKKKTIIAVDDSNLNLIIYKKILKPLYDIYTVSSAAKMFKIIEHTRPDLILLDVEMPDINGYETARMLKEQDDFREIPIIFLTARNDPVSQKIGLNLGAADYIFKPIEGGQLIERIGKLLSSPELPATDEKP
jgi:putative two-component system response regulator